MILESQINQWILPVILVVVVIFLFVMNYIRSRKYQQSAKDAADALKVGDKIVTRSGIFGTIIEMRDTVSGRIATIETGSKNNKSYMSIDVAAIYGVADDATVVYDIDGNLINSETKEVIIKAPEKQPEPVVEAEAEKEPVKEAKKARTTEPAKKTTTRKVKEADKAVAEVTEPAKKRGRKPKTEA